MSAYYESMLIGIVDGTTGAFNDDCRGGLVSSIRAAFTLMDNVGIYDPRKLSKFALSNTSFTEATNTVYAFCDVSHLATQFTYLADYSNYEQYIVLASRVGGAFINQVPELYGCIKNG